MKDNDFVEAVDHVLFYSNAGGGSAVFHEEDLKRYLKLLPENRWRKMSVDVLFDVWVYHPLESSRHGLFRSCDCYVGNHASLGIVKIGWGGSSGCTSYKIYQPEGEEMTIHEYVKRLDDLLTKTEPLYYPVYMNETDAVMYLGSWGSERFKEAVPHYRNKDKTRKGILTFGVTLRDLHVVPWVTEGTVVLGWNDGYSQRTPTIYMWSKPPVPNTRFDRL
jgi:hypothetical protein